MADRNTGTPIAWELGGAVEIGASDHNVLWIEQGSLSLTDPGREGISNMDRGSLTGVVHSGNQRPATLQFQVRPTQRGLQNAGDLRLTLMPADAAGLKSTYTVKVKIPDYPRATTGTLITLSQCWWPDGLSYEARGGQQTDVITVRLQCEGGVSYTSF